MAYSVIVGNIGTVRDRISLAEAETVYREYVAQSKSKIGRAGHEPVYILATDHGRQDIVREHYCLCRQCKDNPGGY
jgi:hypothetical protein